MATRKKRVRRKTINAIAIQIRGNVLQEFSFLEYSCDHFIAEYFCRDTKRGYFLMGGLLAQVYFNFDYKRELIKLILDRDYKEFLKENKDFNSDLTEVQRIRNIIAHRKVFLHNSKSFNWEMDSINFETMEVKPDPKTDASLVRFKPREINKTEYRNTIAKIKRLNLLINRLFDDMIFDRTAKDSI